MPTSDGWDNLKVMQQPGVTDIRRMKHGGKWKLAVPLTDDEQDEVEVLLALAHVINPDREVDTALEKGPVESRRFDSRTLIDQRVRLSNQLLAYLRASA